MKSLIMGMSKREVLSKEDTLSLLGVEGEHAKNVDNIYLITAEGCDGCDEAKETVKKHNLNVEVLDVTKSEKAAEIALSTGLYFVPAFVVKKGNKYIVVDSDEDDSD